MAAESVIVATCASPRVARHRLALRRALRRNIGSIKPENEENEEGSNGAWRIGTACRQACEMTAGAAASKRESMAKAKAAGEGDNGIASVTYDAGHQSQRRRIAQHNALSITCVKRGKNIA
jgi:hypothetical protein